MAHDVPTPQLIDCQQPAVESVAPVRNLQWMRVEEFLRSRELATNTRKAYGRQLKQFSEWSEGRPWHDITHRDIDRYKHHLKQQASHRGGNLSPGTINQAIATLKSFFKWLTVKDYISRNPTLTVELLKEPVKPPRDLADEAVSQLFETLSFRGRSEVRDRAILQVLSHGLRASEGGNSRSRRPDAASIAASDG